MATKRYRVTYTDRIAADSPDEALEIFLAALKKYPDLPREYAEIKEIEDVLAD